MGDERRLKFSGQTRWGFLEFDLDAERCAGRVTLNGEPLPFSSLVLTFVAGMPLGLQVNLGPSPPRPEAPEARR